MFKLKILLVLSLIIFSSFNPQKSSNFKWGFNGHQRINRMAIFLLPPEMLGFYKNNIEFLTDHSTDPDKRRYAVEGEAQKHYIDIDHYAKKGENPFETMPIYWNQAIEKFTEDTLQTYGIVPWHIQKMKFNLQKAFEEKNVDLILKYSAEIGHYIGDAHVPLHTTENYNGQLTNQKGIHGLWESRLIELNADNYNYFIGKATYIDNIAKYIWNTVKESHFALDSVFRFEKEVSLNYPNDKKYAIEARGNQNLQVYSREFSQAYHQKLNGMVERRLRSSIQSIASIWYTAWVDAGQPDLTSILNSKLSTMLIEEYEKLNKLPQLHDHGSICE